MIAHSRPWLTESDAQAVTDTLWSEMIAQGQTTARFESGVSHWLGVGHPGVAVASGSAALCLALTALEVGDGDEVVIPTYVDRSVLDAVCAAGARPVVADVGPNWVVTPEQVAPLVGPRTVAIVVAHTYGIFADVAAFRQFGVPIVEDSAQALGGCREWPLAGDIGVFSFQATKCLTTGEGGMAIGRDPAINECLRVLRDGGAGARRSFAPLSNLAAALGLSQLSRYREALARRATIANAYRRALGDAADSLLRRTPWHRMMHFRFPLSVEGGIDASAGAFAAHGITARRGMDELMHRVLGEPDAKYPSATELFETTVSVPIYPALTDWEMAICATALGELSHHRLRARLSRRPYQSTTM